MLSLAVGCGSKASSDSAAPAAESTSAGNAGSAASGTTGDSAAADAADTAAGASGKADADTADNKGANTSKDASAADAAKDDAADTAVKDAADSIINNGGHFVKSGSNVYFRNPSFDQLKGYATWGDYIDMYIPGGSSIVAYDTTTEDVTELFADNGYGPIYIAGDHFYLNEGSDDTDYFVDIVSMDGKEHFSTDPASVSGVIGDKAVLSSFDHDHNRVCIDIYEGTKKTASVYYDEYADNADAANASAGSTSNNASGSTDSASVDLPRISKCCGIAGDNVIFELMTVDPDSPEGNYMCELWSYNVESGHSIRLGKLHQGSTEYVDYPDFGECDQFEYADGKIWLGCGYYEGTGHFLYDFCFMEADPAVEGSLSLISPDSIDTSLNSDGAGAASAANAAAQDLEYARTPAFTVSGGKLRLADGAAGTATVLYGGDDLIKYDENGKSKTIASGFGMVEDTVSDTRTIVELAECVDGDIYLVQNTEHRDYANDIGWREAYVRDYAYIIKVNEATGEQSIIGFAQNPSLVEGDVDQTFVDEMDLIINAAPEIAEYLGKGMVLRFEDTMDIDGKNCSVYVLGTDKPEQFVAEERYAADISDNSAFKYDVVNDKWNKIN